MKKSIFTPILLIAIGTSVFGQNRMKFKHKLSQKIITDAGFVLKDGAGQPLTIGGTGKLRCLIKLDSKGNILVDFWQISHGTFTKRHMLFWKKTYTLIDAYRGQNGIVNSQTSFNIDKPSTLTDRREFIGDPTKVLYVPYSGFTFGVATIPFRLRGSAEIASTEKTKTTVTSPKPDIAFTGGWTTGKSVITNRSIINYSVTFGAFVGLTGAEIKDGVVKSGSELYGTKKTQTNPAFSYGASATLARNNLGLVFALGFDTSLGDYSGDWIYQNKPWFGIGLSANLGIF